MFCFRKMSFKIVSTLRRGRRELCTVPSQWEHRGQLRWPRYNVDTLIKDSSVQPRADWLTMSCSLKRKNFQSYEDAEEELANMLNKTDTDTDFDQISSAQTYLTIPNPSVESPDYNSMAQDLVCTNLYIVFSLTYKYIHSIYVCRVVY